MPHSERQRWSEEEDAILLATDSADDAIEELRNRGFPERTRGAVWERRKVLRRQLADAGGGPRPLRAIEMELSQLRHRLIALQMEYDAALREQQARLRDELERIDARLRGEPGVDGNDSPD